MTASRAAGRRAGGRRGRADAETLAVDTGTVELVPDPDRPDAYTLVLDGAAQSHVDLADPTRLEFEYMRRFGHVVDHAAPTGERLSVLHLGGGGLSLPRYVAATRPGSPQRVVELDGALVDLVRRRLPLPRGCRPRVRVGEARAVLESLRAGQFDLLVVDVYAGGRIPPALTTVEFVTAAARVLRRGGWYLANVADGAGLRFVRSQVAGLRAVFDDGLLVADAGVLRGRRYGNVVLLAGDGPLPVPELTRLAAGDAFPGRVVHGGALERFVAGAAVSTDADLTPPPAPPSGPFGDLG